MVTNLNEEQTRELREDFDYADSDADGTINLQEFLELLEGLEAGLSEEETRLGFEEIDTDNDGGISFVEFVDWWCEQ